jgi:hypothetical protein
LLSLGIEAKKIPEKAVELLIMEISNFVLRQQPFILIHLHQSLHQLLFYRLYGLFALNKLAFQVELAFATAYSMSKSNETIYEADFQTGAVKEFYANYRGDPLSPQ